VLRRLREITADVISELSAADPQARRVAESYQTFQRDVRSWGDISTVAYLEASALDRG
jgi:TRAP-type mannitol/chloroaromatic compound transport system substrate-binding protein